MSFAWCGWGLTTRLFCDGSMLWDDRQLWHTGCHEWTRYRDATVTSCFGLATCNVTDDGAVQCMMLTFSCWLWHCIYSLHLTYQYTPHIWQFLATCHSKTTNRQNLRWRQLLGVHFVMFTLHCKSGCKSLTVLAGRCWTGSPHICVAVFNTYAHRRPV